MKCPSLYSSLLRSDLFLDHILVMTTATSSLITSLYTVVFTLLHVFFLKFDANYVILRLLASVEHLKQFIISRTSLCHTPIASTLKKVVYFTWQMLA